MKLSYVATLLLLCASASAQPNLPIYQPFRQVQQFLQLTDSQLQAILQNNGDYDQYARTKQVRISQVQSEIATETAKDTLDPMALGIRYAEIEGICRELKDQASTYQQKNVSALTDAQKAKLQMLLDAMKLAPVISDAQSGNLIGTPNYAPLLFTSNSIGVTAGTTLGIFNGPVSGCYSPFPAPAFRAGDFASGVNATNRVSGATKVQTHWFDTTKFIAPK